MKFKINGQRLFYIGLSFLVGLSVWLGNPMFSAFAQIPTLTHELYFANNLLEDETQVSQERKKRVEGIEECRQYLNQNSDQTIAHTDAPLDQTGSKQLVGALKTTNQPQLTKGELNFKRCLEQQGLAPTTGEPISN